MMINKNLYPPPEKNSYVMFGADISLYSGKLRSYLRKKGISFIEKPATYACYKNFIVPRSTVRYIPVLQTADDDVWQDTTEIINRLEVLYPENPAIPSTAKQQLAAHLIELYADQWLLKTALYFRWCAPKDSLKEIWTGFGSLLFPKYPKLIQRWMGKKISGKFRSFIPGLGIRPETHKAIKTQTFKLMEVLEQHFSNHAFILGGLPSVADYALIGVFYAHLYRDVYSGKLLRSKAPKVVEWVERMMSEDKAKGVYLADDEVPETLNWIFSTLAEEQAPVLIDTAENLHQWHQLNQGTEVPRRLGEHEFTINGVKSRRVIIGHAQFMMQRPLSAFQQHASDVSLQQWCKGLGLEGFLNYQVKSVIGRDKNRFVFID